MKTDLYTKTILTIIAVCLLYSAGKDMVVPAYAARNDVVDVNIVAVSGNRIGVYDKALPVKISARMNGIFTKHTCHACVTNSYICQRALKMP
jgi:hypothetical protein